MSDPSGVEVIVPVYGAGEALARCLATLERHTDGARHRVTLVLDGPQPPAVDAAVAAFGRAEVRRLAVRGGFAAAVNDGIAATRPARRDIVLLNADTQVAAGWLDGLAQAAASGPRVATVTPLTNAGTIASVPRWLEENTLPAGYDVDRFAALVARVSRRLYPRLPTGVGHCLWLRRAALEEVGGFDEATWGLGYGEETDLCLRLAAQGWENVLDDATFIFHEGQASFGAGRGRRVRRAERRLRRRHPGFWRDLAAFLAADPLAEARTPLLAALAAAANARTGASGPALEPVAHVVHGWPPWSQAGTEIYAARLVAWQTSRGRPVSVYARLADEMRSDGAVRERLEGAVRVRLRVNNFRSRHPLVRNALSDPQGERDFARFLAAERPGIVHLHHLAGHGLGLARVAARSGAAVVWQLQDWWGLCARANLLDRARRLCPGPAPGRCAGCLQLTALPPAPLLNRLLFALRRELVRRAMRRASGFVAGSTAVVESYRRSGLLPAGVPVWVLDYGVPPPGPTHAPPRHREPGWPLVVGFLGSLLPHKGAHLLAAAAASLPPGSVELRLWGDASVDPAYVDEVRRAAGETRLELRERFPEDERDAAFAGIDLLAVPSLGLESYGIAAREALVRGIPVLASSRGALAELFGGAREGRGALFDPERPGELVELLGSAVRDPGRLARWREAPALVGSSEGHAACIDALYQELLARRAAAS